MTFEKRLKLRQIAAVICFLAGIGMIFLSFRLEEQEGFLYLHSYYCGGGGGIIGCESDNDFIQITVKLIEKGYTEEDIAKIWGGNLMRVLDEVQATASVKTL